MKPQHNIDILSKLINFFLNHIILILSVFFCIGLGMAFFNMSALSSRLIEAQALQFAESEAQSITEANKLYSSEVVSRAKSVDGITVTHNYPVLKGAIPLPATFTIELGRRISDKGSGRSVRLFSGKPFPWRKTDGGPKDEFEHDALAFIEQHPREKFSRIENKNGRRTLRYGQAVIMESSCIACHNTHPDTPKDDWKVGDVRGILEITKSLDTFVEQTQNGLRGTFFMLGGLSLLGLFGLTLVFGRMRKTAEELEARVEERTTDLANVNLDLEKRNKLIRHVFGRYLSNDIVANLLESPEGLKLGGERRKITILASDLRGFTALAERMPPETVIKILNLYLKEMADVIDQYQGTIDEFMGDGILVLFGAPTPGKDDAVRAVACACAMQLKMGAVNERMKQNGLPKLGMGIGINTGEVVVGNIGSEKRTKYGIVGNNVNRTYRIESYTHAGQVLISEQTFKDAGETVKIRSCRLIKPKGVKKPITICEVNGIGGFDNLYLPVEDEKYLPLKKPIAIQYMMLKGNKLDDRTFKGKIVEVSSQGAKVIALQDDPNSIPPQLSNIKLNFSMHKKTSTLANEDLYAKIEDKKTTEHLGFYIRYTSIPQKVGIIIDRLYMMLQEKES